MKKILFLSPLPPPYYGSAISSKLCLDILKSDSRFEVENIRLNYTTKMSDLGKINFNKLYGLIRVTIQIVHLIKRFNPEIIYFMPATFGFGLIRDYFFLSLIKMLNHRKLILHLRAQFKRDDWNNHFKKFLIKKVLQCDKVIILGPELIENLNETVPANKIFILTNALPKTLSNNEFGKIISYRNNNYNLNLLFLSIMWKFKGWYKLLEACNLLTNIGVKYTCHFVGDWPSDNERKIFYRYIENNNLNKNIVFHGQLLDKEKNRLLMEANVLVLPTEFDSCPRTILEAMEFALPVISTRVGTIPSLIEHGKTGFILEKNTAIEIFEHLLNLRDIHYRNIIGKNGRERFLEKFTIDTYKNKFLSIINED